MHRPDGPSLPMGEQLRRLLQPKVLPPVPSLRLPRFHARSRPHGLVGICLHGQELPSILLHVDYCDHSCRLFLRRALRPLCRHYVRRPDPMHHGEQFYN